ncbi:protein eva-1 homolog C isoform X2 [Exaiptasia diaphana]|uniref:SUEL-type lectin domain-containing protein n=1 Tax=Exaiptasia diaphana TaxID=2652724 RepID=A0A913XZB8_EXADI|nr:protein eva-1 homolog C isoform X2 [Exaiptasia diaphana]KXJ23758.1 Latrophilin-1 [Exaiptasia diaphana]
MAASWVYICAVVALLFKGNSSQSISNMKTIIACQGSKVRIRCKNSNIIMIFSAFYGRVPGREICYSDKIFTTKCSLEKGKALEVVEKRCSNRSRCNVRADNSMFPDPCPGTFKYMTIIYYCKKRPPNMSTRPPSTRKRRKKTSPTPSSTTTQTTPQLTTTNSTIINTTYAPNITDNTTSNISTTPLVMAAVKTYNPVVTTTVIETTTTLKPPAASGYTNRGQPKYVLILFLSGVAIATVLLLVLLLGLHIRGRRSKKFEIQTDKPLDPDIDDDEDDGVHDGDDDDDDDDSDDENKNVTIEIQDGNEDTKQISVKPGDIIIIDSKDVENDDSEDLGYMSEIVRYYNSRNLVHDDGKQSLTCETPSVNSLPNSDSDKREMPYETVRPANGVCVI